MPIDDAGHAHTADNLGLTSAWYLTAQDAAHSHSADNVALSTTGVMTLTADDLAAIDALIAARCSALPSAADIATAVWAKTLP